MSQHHDQDDNHNLVDPDGSWFMLRPLWVQSTWRICIDAWVRVLDTYLDGFLSLFTLVQPCVDRLQKATFADLQVLRS